MRMDAHETKLDAAENGDVVLIHPASANSVGLVLAADTDSEDGRSPWVWVRLPNGDLVLGVFPQGDTYFSVEADAQYPGDIEDRLWCETCGERPLAVRTQEAGLCCHCAAACIDQLAEELT